MPDEIEINIETSPEINSELELEALYGPKGDKGDTGPQGPQGTRGPRGLQGNDGYSPTATVVKSGNTATITITDKNGTTTAQVSDGVGAITDVKQNGVSVVSDTIANITVPTALSGFTDDIGISGKLDKSGGTMTGQLSFSGLNGSSGSNVPIRTILDYDTNDVTLPSSMKYCNGNLANDNQGVRIARSYIGYSTSGNLGYVWNITNGANAEKTLSYRVTKTGVASLVVGDSADTTKNNIVAYGDIQAQSYDSNPANISASGIVSADGVNTTNTINCSGTNGVNLTSKACIKASIPYDIGDVTLPSDSVYGGGFVIGDSATTQNAVGRSYFRYNTSGDVSYLINLNNKKTDNTDVASTFGFHLDKNGVPSLTLTGGLFYAVDYYTNQNSGYVLYNNNFIMQWGYSATTNTDVPSGAPANYQYADIVFVVPMQNSYYGVTATAIPSSGANQYSGYGAPYITRNMKTGSGLRLQFNEGYVAGVYWSVFGTANPS